MDRVLSPNYAPNRGPETVHSNTEWADSDYVYILEPVPTPWVGCPYTETSGDPWWARCGVDNNETFTLDRQPPLKVEYCEFDIFQCPKNYPLMCDYKKCDA